MPVESDGKNRDAGTRRRLGRLAWLLDNSIRLPGGFRIGLDGIIGLVPGFGDLAGAILSFYIVLRAALLRVPASILARMGLNVLLEVVVGAVPLLGDLFDVAFRANLRNVRLLEAFLDDPGATGAQSRWVIASTLVVLLLFLISMFAIIAGLAGLLWARITA